MARYIDANRLIKELFRWRNDEVQKADFINGIRTAISLTSWAPTADVQKVKHAHWECVSSNDNCYMCTGENGCGYPFLLKEGTPYDNNMIYCPSCGAKMDEKE